MAGYNLKKLQLIGGSWDLNNPGDKVDARNYLLCQNFRLDRAGQLRSRWGYQNYASYPATSGTLHSALIWLGQGVYWGSSAGSLYWASNTSPIAAGFDGNRLGMVGMNAWNWIINRSKQARHTPAMGTAAALSYGWDGPSITQYSSVSFTQGSAGALTLLGEYTVYITFVWQDSATGLLIETNPNTAGQSPTYPTFTLTSTNNEVTINNIPTGPTGFNGRNIYLSGGTLGNAYLAIPYASSYATIEDNTTTSISITLSDLAITNLGIVMPTTNDKPPAASGVVGPYFSRLLAFSTLAHPNRLFWTPVSQPQYWPGAANDGIGNWVDVGEDGEAILWVTLHNNCAVIYKQKSVWILTGDVSTGYLTRVDVATGLTNAFALANAGDVDYFLSPNALNQFNLSACTDISGPIRPLLTTNYSRGTLGPDQSPPGSITTTTSGSSITYDAALGYAMGKLYVAYTELASATQYGAPLLVYEEDRRAWAYHRCPIFDGAIAGFLFDGSQMVGLGSETTPSLGNLYAAGLDDFSVCQTEDPASTPIVCIYQSHYEDAGMPDNQKNWLECVVDCQVTTGDAATVTAYFDNGTATANLVGSSPKDLPLGTINGLTGGTRQQVSFPIGPYISGAIQEGGYLAKNISIVIECSASNQVVIHNVYLYYYVEARLAVQASTLPTDLGIGKVKQAKELLLDIDSTLGAVDVQVMSDLPGNSLAVRQSPTVAQNAGRALLKFPFGVTEGFLWRLALQAATNTAPFRLYSARLLVRPVGVYVEAYEAAGGFVWDSQEQTFESGITKIPRMYAIALAASPIKRFREISLQIDTFNANVTLSFLTDLPGNAQTVRYTTTFNSGSGGRRFMRFPLPAGTNAEIEGRMCRIQLSGSSKFILYEASVELLAMGLYIEAYEAAGGAVYDSRQQDLGTPKVKELRELELDIETSGAVTVQLLSDLATTYNGSVTTTGRQMMMLPLTVNAASEQFFDGRLIQLILSGSNAFRLYGARVLARPYGCELTTSEAAGGALWDSTDLDLGSQTVKQLRELQIEINASAAFTVTVYTDLPSHAMTAQVVSNQTSTTGRTKIQIPLPQGQVPENYIFGRLARVTITSTSLFKLFGARIHARPIGVYIDTLEAGAGAVWDSLPQDLGSPLDKSFDEIRFELDTDAQASVNVYTDLPGEVMTFRTSGVLTAAASSRHWATVSLANLAAITPPWYIEGRSIRLIVLGVAGFRIYRAQVRAARVGRYLAAANNSIDDPLTTLEFDFATERVKQHKKLELDLRADGQVTVTVMANPNGQMITQFTTTVSTPNGRATLYIPLPPGVRGRLLRISLTSANAARIYRLRAWSRLLNDPKAQWEWAEYPLEESDVLPEWKDLPVPPTPDFAWADLPVEPTPPQWAWAPFPVNPTPPGNEPAQWWYAKVLAVEETPDEWQLVDVPVEVVQ